MRRRLLGNRRKVSNEPNTFIGGVASVINTAELLAAKLRTYPDFTAFPVSNIQNFTVVGNNVECYIGVNYQTFNSCFDGLSFPNIVTYYYDDGNYCKKIGQASFRDQSNFKDFRFNGALESYSYSFSGTPIKIISLPSLTKCGPFGFINSNMPKKYYLPNINDLGGTVQNNNVWQDSNFTGTRIYINPIMATINGGAPDGDLTATTNATIRYIQNFTKPSVITNLSHSGGVLNFTPPASANALDFYEVYVNGFYFQEITGSGASVTGLNAGDKVTVYACDIYYNRSKSNEITI